MGLLSQQNSDELVREQFRSMTRSMPFVYGMIFALDLVYVFYTRNARLSAFQYLAILTIGALSVGRAARWRNIAGAEASFDLQAIRKIIRNSEIFTVAICPIYIFAAFTLVSELEAESKIIVMGVALATAIVAAIHHAFVPRLAFAVLASTITPIIGGLLLSGAPRYQDAALAISILGAAQMFVISRQFENFKEIVESHEALRITQARLETAERAALAQAQSDALTGLYNRRRFDLRAEEIAQAPEGRAAVALIDLDGFKALNDTQGHSAGDMLLKLVAGRLYEQLHPYGDVIRLGGDEFALICGEPALFAELEGAMRIALGEISRPYVLPATIARVGGSCGLCIGRPGDSLDAITAAADKALYEVKNAGKGFVKVVAPFEREAPEAA